MGMETIARMIMANNASLPGVDDFTRGAQGIQGMMNGQLEYAQARDNYEAQKGLRSLFAQNPNPDIGQIGALSPEFAQKYMMNDLSMREKALGIRKTQGEIGNIDSQRLERDAKLWAPMIGALAEQYLDQPDSPEFRAKLGQLIADGQKQGLSIAPGFNIETMTADKLLNIAISRGYESPAIHQRYEVDTQAQKNALAPPVPPEIAYPRTKWDDKSGQFVTQEPTMPMSPGGRARTAGGGYRVMKPQQMTPSVDVSGVTNLDDLHALYKTLPNGSADKLAVGARINELQDDGASYEGETDERPSAGITPEQNRAARVEQAAATEKAKEEAKDAVKRESTAEADLTLLEGLPHFPNIESLIDQSMSSGVEARIKEFTGGVLGMKHDDRSATQQLQTIAGNLRRLVMGIAGPGDLSKSEQDIIENASGKIADPNTDPETRKINLHTVLNIARSKIQKYPELRERFKQLELPDTSGGNAAIPASGPWQKYGGAQ